MHCRRLAWHEAAATSNLCPAAWSGWTWCEHRGSDVRPNSRCTRILRMSHSPTSDSSNHSRNIAEHDHSHTEFTTDLLETQTDGAKLARWQTRKIPNIINTKFQNNVIFQKTDPLFIYNITVYLSFCHPLLTNNAYGRTNTNVNKHWVTVTIY